MINYKLKKNGTYLVSCNFSPDGMALVDMLLQEKVKMILVYIDYGKGEFAGDIEGLAEYAFDKDIRLEVRKAPEAPENKDDYGAWAREVRYDFFKEIYVANKASGLILPHSQDDLLESYLYQRDHKAALHKHGMTESSMISGMVVIRPLLHLSRQDLVEYADEHRVPYSKHAAEFELYHTKSAYYREIASMSEIDRENLIREMEFRNDETIKMDKEMRSLVDESEELDIRALISLDQDAYADTINRFLAKADEEIEVTEELLKRIRAFCLSPLPNDSIQLGAETYLIKEYDNILIGHRFDELPYTYTLDAPGRLVTPNFYLDFSNGAEDRGIHADDYPITIRSALPYDTYVVHGYLESVHRLYTLWKMPMRLRYIWPIFVNKKGKIVYVPRYRRNFVEERTSVLKMKLKDEER